MFLPGRKIQGHMDVVVRVRECFMAASQNESLTWSELSSVVTREWITPALRVHLIVLRCASVLALTMSSRAARRRLEFERRVHGRSSEKTCDRGRPPFYPRTLSLLARGKSPPQLRMSRGLSAISA